MKRTILSIILGAILAIPCCYGAFTSQYKQEPLKRQYEVYEVANIEVEEPEHISTVQLDMKATAKADAEATLESNSVVIPDDVKEYCEEAGEKYNICPEFLEAMCWRESNCNPNAVNGSCTGIMQVSKIWHGDRMKEVGATDLTDAQDCINTAANYLSELFEKYEDAGTVLAVYNGDSKALKSGYVSDYANDILTISEALERIDNK